MRRHAAVGAVLRLYPAVAVGDIEVLLTVMRRGRQVVVHADGYGDFVLHVSIACGGT